MKYTITLEELQQAFAKPEKIVLASQMVSRHGVCKTLLAEVQVIGSRSTDPVGVSYTVVSYGSEDGSNTKSFLSITDAIELYNSI